MGTSGQNPKNTKPKGPRKHKNGKMEKYKKNTKMDKSKQNWAKIGKDGQEWAKH